MHHKNDKETKGTTVLGSLRSLMPARQLSLREALQITELQAARLLEMQEIAEVPVPDEIVTSLPRIVVQSDSALPASISGCSDWDARRRVWVIAINPREPHTRRRLTMLHEYKHIIDHGSAGLLQPHNVVRRTAPEEFLADYFAGCVLMPRRALKSAWARGLQDPLLLARLFDVSVRAIEVRLNQIGLLWDGAVDVVPGRRAAVDRWPHQYLRRGHRAERHLEFAR